MSKRFDLNWKGMLTTENTEEICRFLQELLKDSYTFVSVNEAYRFKPEVRIHQHLESTPEKSITFSCSQESTGLYVSDDSGVWVCYTELKEDKNDGKFNNPHFCFEGDRVTITHRAPSGDLIYSVFISEKE